MALAMPCKTSKKCKHGETRGKTNEIKSKLACILEASESTRLRLEESLPNYHEDHSAGKGENSLQHLNLVTNLFLCHKPWRFPQQKQQWIKNVRNWKRFRRGTWRKSKVKKRWSMKQGRRVQKFTLPHLWTSVIWRLSNWRQSTTNRKVVLYSEAILWKMILDLMQYLQNKNHEHHKWRQQKSWISYPDFQGAQLTQYLLVPRSKRKMLQNYWKKFPNRNVQTFGFVYHDTSGQNHGPVWKTQSFFLNEICMVILWQDCYGKGNSRKFFWSTVGRRFPLGMLSRTPWKRIVLVCVCGWPKHWLERNTTLIRCGKYSTKMLF